MYSSKTLVVILLILSAMTGSGHTAQGKEDPRNVLLRQFDIEFEGETVQDLVLAIEREIGTKLNIVVDKVAAEMYCPPMMLRSVSAYSVVRSLQGILMGVDSEYDLHSGCLTDPYDRDAILFVSCTPKRDTAHPGILTQVRNLDIHLEHHELDDIITAIRSAWDMAGVGADVSFKFHEDTKLLMAHCRSEVEVMLLNEVLRELMIG